MVEEVDLLAESEVRPKQIAAPRLASIQVEDHHPCHVLDVRSEEATKSHQVGGLKRRSATKRVAASRSLRASVVSKHSTQTHHRLVFSGQARYVIRIS